MADGTEVMFENLQSSRNSSVAEIQLHGDGHAGKVKRRRSKRKLWFILSKASSMTLASQATPSKGHVILLSRSVA